MQCLKNCLQFNVLEGSVSSINPIPTDAFWPRNHWQWNDPHNVFIWIENCYLLTWNLAHTLCNLNALKEAIKFFWIWHEFFTEVIIYQHLQQVTYLLQEHFYLNIYYGNILLHFGLEGVKIHKIQKMFFSYPPPTNLQCKIIHSCNYS